MKYYSKRIKKRLHFFSVVKRPEKEQTCRRQKVNSCLHQVVGNGGRVVGAGGYRISFRVIKM